MRTREWLVVALLLTTPAAAQTGWRGSAVLDEIVQQAVQKDEIPGAVLLVSHQGQIVHRKAYGNRSLVPQREAMTVDTIFDCASLTKVVATTSAMMLLVEAGKVRINDRVNEYLPEFSGGHSPITVRHLMTHFSGLRPDVDIDPAWSGYETGIKRALAEKPMTPPGVRFIYSDINFILLGEIVRRVSGQTLPEFTTERVFSPLGMKETMFTPPASLRPRIAPTERLQDGTVLRGVVHDPTSRYMGGVAGHAGLFSTGDDLGRFADMLLGGGRLGTARVFSPLTVEKMSTPQSPPNHPAVRGLGWDIDSPYASNRGELLPVGSFGHTGFTGTSLWIDPATKTWVLLLANSVHPHRRPAIISLRSRVATAVAAALPEDSLTDRLRASSRPLTSRSELLASAPRQGYRNGHVLTGLDVLVRDRFRVFQGKKVGLITNHSGIDRQRRRNIDLFLAAGIKPVVILSPEHGLLGQVDDNVGDTVDRATGIRVLSLYEENRRRPTPEMLRGVDALVFDIQDVGARFYTYPTTMAYAMEAAARQKIPFYVLDRPDPINGVLVEGPLLDPKHVSFNGYYPLPVRHGMTIGELARFFNAENKIGAQLEVIRMEGWERADFFDETGLPWVDPSPNLRTLSQAVVYPGIAMLERLTNYSVGRGTDTPFEFIGADWIDGPALAAYLNEREIPGVRFYAAERTPTASHLAGKKASGVQIVVTNRAALDATHLGVEVAAALGKLFPGRLDLTQTAQLIGNEKTIQELARGEDPRQIRAGWQDALEKFRQVRARYLLY